MFYTIKTSPRQLTYERKACNVGSKEGKERERRSEGRGRGRELYHPFPPILTLSGNRVKGWNTRNEIFSSSKRKDFFLSFCTLVADILDAGWHENRRLYVDPIQSCVLNITLAVLVQVSCVIHPRPTHVH
jgi:hypothetical protein